MVSKEWRMKSMPYYFMSDGGVHGHQRCHTVAPAHAHNNLLRWVGVAVFGLSHTLLVTGRRMFVSVLGSLLEISNALLFAYPVWRGRAALDSRLTNGC
jgi:hypothetical protein